MTSNRVIIVVTCHALHTNGPLAGDGNHLFQARPQRAGSICIQVICIKGYGLPGCIWTLTAGISGSSHTSIRATLSTLGMEASICERRCERPEFGSSKMGIVLVNKIGCFAS